MAIRTIKEQDIYLTEAELERLRREWAETQTYTTAPTSFEVWVRAHLANNKEVTQHDVINKATGSTE